MTDDRVREIFHEELSHHALAGGILDTLFDRTVHNYAHDHVTPATLEPGVAAARDYLRMLLHRLDDKLAAVDTVGQAVAFAAVLWRAITPVVGVARTPGLPSAESPGGAKDAAGAGEGADPAPAPLSPPTLATELAAELRGLDG